MKTITETLTFFFFVKNALQSACGWMKTEVFENDYVQCTRSLQIEPSGCGDKNGHEIIYRFRLVGPKAIQNWLNFWAGIFFKRGKNLQISVFLNVDWVLAGKIFWMKWWYYYYDNNEHYPCSNYDNTPKDYVLAPWPGTDRVISGQSAGNDVGYAFLSWLSLSLSDDVGEQLIQKGSSFAHRYLSMDIRLILPELQTKNLQTFWGKVHCQ